VEEEVSAAADLAADFNYMPTKNNLMSTKNNLNP